MRRGPGLRAFGSSTRPKGVKKGRLRKKRTEGEWNKKERILATRQRTKTSEDHFYKQRRRKLRVIEEFNAGRSSGRRKTFNSQYPPTLSHERMPIQAGENELKSNNSIYDMIEDARSRGEDVCVFANSVVLEKPLLSEVEDIIQNHKAQVSTLGPGLVGIAGKFEGLDLDPVFAAEVLPDTKVVRGGSISTLADTAASDHIIPFLDSIPDETWSSVCVTADQVNKSSTEASLHRRASLIDKRLDLILKNTRKRSMRRRVKGGAAAGFVQLLLVDPETMLVSTSSQPQDSETKLGSTSAFWDRKGRFMKLGDILSYFGIQAPVSGIWFIEGEGENDSADWLADAGKAADRVVCLGPSHPETLMTAQNAGNISHEHDSYEFPLESSVVKRPDLVIFANIPDMDSASQVISACADVEGIERIVMRVTPETSGSTSLLSDIRKMKEEAAASGFGVQCKSFASRSENALYVAAEKQHCDDA